MRNLIIIAVLIFVGLFVVSFGGSFGYAQGGGKVEILPRTVTATGDDGQIIAAWNIENLNANNTPPKQVPERGAEVWLPTILFFGILTTALLFTFNQMGFFEQKADDNEPYHNWTHYSSVEADENVRKYGPD